MVGLAIARQLAQARPQARTLLLERHDAVGTETSSRNSEVVHNGGYYTRDSLKTALCIRGRELLYRYCAERGIPHRKCGKCIVAQNAEQLSALERMHAHAKGLPGVGVPLEWLTPAQMAAREPHVRALAGALFSPQTGIVDSHALMRCLLGDIEAAGGDVALRCRVVAIEPLAGGGYRLSTSSSSTAPGQPEETEGVEITAEAVVNAAGLGAVAVANMLPQAARRTAHFCKGTYYVPVSRPPLVRTLVYPAPEPGAAGLGTHLTLDLAGNLRFGPDVRWVSDPSDLAATDAGADAARAAVQTYLPAIGQLRPDYAGMRPKLLPPPSPGQRGGGGGVAGVDFWIRPQEGMPGFVNLLGIESPGNSPPPLARGEEPVC